MKKCLVCNGKTKGGIPCDIPCDMEDGNGIKAIVIPICPTCKSPEKVREAAKDDKPLEGRRFNKFWYRVMHELPSELGQQMKIERAIHTFIA